MIDELNIRKEKKCIRCGTCCRNGPPGLHKQDKDLYLKGVLKKQDLITFRRGEWVYDNIKQNSFSLSEEMVRLGSQKNNQACLFLDQKSNDCLIYPNRPLECRAQRCWDSSELMEVYDKDRLTRQDVIPKNSALWEIIIEHETQCSYFQIQEIINKLKQNQDRELLAALAQFVHVDTNMRQLILDRTKTDKKSLDFIFGRSLYETLPTFGLKIINTQNGLRFEPEKYHGLID